VFRKFGNKGKGGRRLAESIGGRSVPERGMGVHFTDQETESHLGERRERFGAILAGFGQRRNPTLFPINQA